VLRSSRFDPGLRVTGELNLLLVDLLQNRIDLDRGAGCKRKLNMDVNEAGEELDAVG
jgi:hypothetical protein